MPYVPLFDFRKIKGFDESFKRGAEKDMAVRASFDGAYFISVNEPLITQYLSSRAHKTLEKDLNARIKLVNKHNKYSVLFFIKLKIQKMLLI